MTRRVTRYSEQVYESPEGWTALLCAEGHEEGEDLPATRWDPATAVQVVTDRMWADLTDTDESEVPLAEREAEVQSALRGWNPWRN